MMRSHDSGDSQCAATPLPSGDRERPPQPRRATICANCSGIGSACSWSLSLRCDDAGGKPLVRSLAAAGFTPEFVEMRDGERYKRLATVEELAEKMTRLGAERDAVVLAFGGGVVGDVGGMLASVYMRGVELVQIPTTVQAQVDASVGGKTGVNLGAGKNLVGTFYQPIAVLIDPAVLATLPEREFRAGLYESLKAGVIGLPELFRVLEKTSIQDVAAGPEAARMGDCGIGQAEGASGLGGRAGRRTSPGAEFWPYHRPRPRVRHPVP